MKLTKRVGAAVTASALALGLIASPIESVPFSFGSAVSAQEQSAPEYASHGQTAALPDSKELEQLWIDSLFYGEGVSFYKDYGKNYLDGASLEVYNLLRTEIEAISSGSRNNTSITLNMTESFADGSDLETGIGEAMDALMADLPADFYWYDKTVGYVYFSEGTKIAKVIFTISENYVAANSSTETVEYSDGTSVTYKINVDTAKITAATASAANAQAIAAKYSGKSDYEKVMGYKDEICSLVDYNDDAAGDDSTPYGDPWQLVWVFDNDPSTKVVCEGYSKAFQYLCDLSGIECYTVSGYADGGRHMWNIVVLDGKSYHVDVTWCDGGFDYCLKGAASSDGNGFTMHFEKEGYASADTVYEYYPETVGMYGPEILTVSTEDYDPNAAVGEVTISITPDELDIAVGEEGYITVEVTSEKEINGYLECTYVSDIVSVSDGEDPEGGTGTVYTVTGIAEGTATLTFEWSSDEIELDPPCTITCTVTVTAAECVHEWGTEWKNDETSHWHICGKCGAASEKGAHEPGDEATEDAPQLCTVCEYEIAPKLNHTHVWDITTWEKDETGHWRTCTKCDTGKTDVIEHTMVSKDNAEEPTCVDAGKETDMICSVCDYLEEGKVIPATGKHTMTEVPNSAKEPTCAEAGKEADMECSVCGLKETGKTVPATGKHQAGEPERQNVIAATCTEEGSYDEVVKCKDCGAIISTEKKTIEKIDHTPGSPVKENDIAPSCTKDGSYDMVTKCTECGETIETEHVVVPAEGHDFGALIQGETTHYQECAKCHEKIGEKPHTEDSGRVTTMPTTDTDGVRTYSCSMCGKELRTEVIPALGENHEHSYTILNSDASGHWHECVCGAKDTLIPHNTATKEEIVLEAVCNADGLKYFITYCTDCGWESSQILDIPKTGIHSAGTDYGKDSTGHWNTCTFCGTVMDKEPHQAGPAATETTPQTCTVCGYEIAPVLAHTHTFSTDWTKDDNFHWHAATCQHTEEVSGMALHAWDNGVITVQPTETSKGVKTFSCTVCGAAKTEPVSEITHVHTPGTAWKSDITGHWHECGSCSEKLDFAAHNEISEVTKLPTATVTGMRRYYCSICGYVIREEVIPATGIAETPSYPSGSTIVFPPVTNTKEPILDNGSGKTGWESIADDIKNAGNGNAVFVDMNNTTTLSKIALKELAGKNTDLVLKMNDKITWTINGETVSSTRDVNMRARLNTNNIPESVLEIYTAGNSIIQLSLSHNGSFGFDAVMTVALGSRYDGKYANLLYYDQRSGELEFVDCSMISGGMAALDFSHASEYAIVISDEPMGDYEDVSAAAGISEKNSIISVESSVLSAVAVIAAIAAAIYIFRKRVSK